MPDLTKPPDLKFINDALKYLEDLWSKAHGTFGKMDALVNRTFPIWPADITRPEYRPSTPTSTVSNSANRLLAFNPKFHRPPASDRQPSRDWTSPIENAVAAIWRDAGLKSMQPTDRVISVYFSLYGYAVGQDVWNLSRRPMEPEREDFTKDDQESFDQAMRAFDARKRSFNPFERHAPHPTTVLMDMQMRPSMAIEKVSMRADLLQEWTEGIKRPSPGVDRSEVVVFDASDNPFEDIELLFFWSNHWAALALPPPDKTKMKRNQEMLYVLPNTFGFIRSSHAFSGMGFETGINIGDPDAAAVGILRAAEDSIQKQAQSLTALHHILQRDAFTPLVTPREPDEVFAGMQLGILKGDITDFAYFPTIIDKLSSALSQIADVADRDIEFATFSRILSGFRSEGVNSVGQTSILSEAAERLFDVIASQMSHLATESAQHLLALVDIDNRPISLAGHTLAPNMIERDYTINAEFKFVNSVKRLQERQMSMAEFDRQLIDRETYLTEVRGTEDVAGVLSRINEDNVRRDPIIAMAEAQLTAERILPEEIRERAALLRREQEQANRGRSTNGNFPGSRAAETLDVDRTRDVISPDAMNPPRIPGGV